MSESLDCQAIWADIVSCLYVGYIGSPILTDGRKPLDTLISISSSKWYSTSDADEHLKVNMRAFSQVGKYLVELLEIELKAMTHPKIFGKYRAAQHIADELRSQLVAYVYQQPPFNLADDSDPYHYWEQLREEPRAEILAVRYQSSEASSCDLAQCLNRCWGLSCSRYSQIQCQRSVLCPASQI